MRKNLTCLMLLLTLVFLTSTFSNASVGIDLDGVNQGATEHINFIRGGTTAAQSGSNFNVPIAADGLIVAGAANGGAVSMLSSTTAIPVSYSYVNMQITTSDPAFSAKTLADGKPGQILTIHVYSGSSTTTVTPSRHYGFSSLSFNAVDDSATLLYINDTDGWAVLSVTSVTVTP